MITLFTNAIVVTMNPAMEVLENAFVQVTDEQITYVGTDQPEEAADREIDCKGKVLMPGMVDAHTHLPMSLLRGYADGAALDSWLNDYIFPAENRMDRRSVTAAVDVSLAELIANGVTCFADMYDYSDVIADRTLKAGLSANIARGVVCFDEASFDPKTYYSMVEQRELLSRYQDAGKGRIRIDASIHGCYTSFPGLWRYQVSWARENNLGIHVHLSETQNEFDTCMKNYGKSPVKAFYDEGVFDVRTIAAHCVYLTEEDLHILAEKKVNAIHNPVSNLKLGSGIADVPALVKKGVNVALGTDGVSSNDNHDLFEEMKLAALLPRGVKKDALALSAQDALKMATVSGARALGRNTGVIEKGRPADIIMVDFTKPALTPHHSVLSNLVFAARGGDVCLTMAYGKVLYENGEWKTIDVEKAVREVNEYGAPLVAGKIEGDHD